MRKIAILFSVLALCLCFCSCGIFSLKKSETRLVVEEVIAWNVGHELAKMFPQHVPGVIEGIDLLLLADDLLLVQRDFHKWVDYILDIVVKDTAIKGRFGKLMVLVEVNLSSLDRYEEKAVLIRKLLTDFVDGVKAAD